ncbi:hypothetical protein DS745_03860 [Anaerobacillus alkaliphilus]|uniref:DUF2178 domain-containing protein n=1 Tax=Anaerobacillus alkaliphilus TaxID=1548597 RepID=A0A4Q0VZX0_9BACI|nr:hypothetical protein [Anaerobacillus alkaliphilus]RXJ04528.1 hypothetical protein DS745_03860 [Anaerobacillus alkaliphilus]
MNPYKSGVLLISFLTILYAIIAIIFTLNDSFLRSDFVSDVMAIKGVGNDVPVALGVAMSFIWLLFGAVYLKNKKVPLAQETGQARELIAATNESVETRNMVNNDQRLNTKLVWYMIGSFIFGGLLTVSLIDANFYINKYSEAKLLEFRIATVGFALSYFLIAYMYFQKK